MELFVLVNTVVNILGNSVFLLLHNNMKAKQKHLMNVLLFVVFWHQRMKDDVQETHCDF